METKHTREFAGELADQHINPKLNTVHKAFAKTGYMDGYMKAIEETNVVELFDALVYAKKMLNIHADVKRAIDMKYIDQAINKAK